uniref:Uncharacterized protein n=1 Tax=Anas zonorhyncha TaxID=75864 RepID=A0A8B9V748_9AVES
MSDYWYWRLVPCKESSSCNCFATGNRSNEEKEEETNHQVVVSDIMQLVRDKQEVPESTAAGRDPQGSSSPTPGSTQDHPKISPYD